jgi:hypothetical protein
MNIFLIKIFNKCAYKNIISKRAFKAKVDEIKTHLSPQNQNEAQEDLDR